MLGQKIRDIEFMSPLVAVQNLFNLSARLIVQLKVKTSSVGLKSPKKTDIGPKDEHQT